MEALLVLTPLALGRAARLAEAAESGAVRAPAAGRTNVELVQEIAQRAEAWGVRHGLGKGPEVGILKHEYAKCSIS
jgi:hypothetical protein